MESATINNSIKSIKEVRKLFNELRSNLSREEINKIRKKIHIIEAVYSILFQHKDNFSSSYGQKSIFCFK